MDSRTAISETGCIEEPNLEVISFAGVTLAMIIRDSFSKEGVNFLTPKEFPQQLAYMEHPAGKVIDSHLHNPLPRHIQSTQEVLLIKRGRMLVKLYSDDREFITSRILNAGDVIFLASGGHGFEVMDDVSFFEVKQGPYIGEQEKVRFKSSQ